MHILKVALGINLLKYVILEDVKLLRCVIRIVITSDCILFDLFEYDFEIFLDLRALEIIIDDVNDSVLGALLLLCLVEKHDPVVFPRKFMKQGQ